MPDTLPYSSTVSAAVSGADEAKASALSWASIIGGAVATLAVSVILLTFGASLGLAPTSPPDTGRMAATITSIAAIWLIVTQWLASAIGGYLTGRLRTKWVAVHTHEVFFRDTAHGFLTWSVAMIAGALILTSGATVALGHMHGIADHRGEGPAQDGPMAYYVDMLYRINGYPQASAMAPQLATASAPESVPVNGTEPAAAAGLVPPNGNAAAPAMTMPHFNHDMRAESMRILSRGAGPKGLSDDDKNYLAQMVSQSTGLWPGDAMKRVNDVVDREKADGTAMRKAASHMALFTSLSMLIGAFIASAAAAFGGSQRDEWDEAVRTGKYAER